MAVEQEYTDVIVVNEDKKQPSNYSLLYILCFENVFMLINYTYVLYIINKKLQ